MGWKQREGHNFLRLRKGRGHEKLAVKRGKVMQIYPRDHAEVHPQKKKEVLSLVKKKKIKEHLIVDQLRAIAVKWLFLNGKGCS